MEPTTAANKGLSVFYRSQFRTATRASTRIQPWLGSKVLYKLIVFPDETVSKETDTRLLVAEKERKREHELAKQREREQMEEIERLQQLVALHKQNTEVTAQNLKAKNDQMEAELDELNRARKEAENKQQQAKQIATQKEAEAHTAMQAAEKARKEAEEVQEKLNRDPQASMDKITEILDLQRKQSTAPPPPKSEFSQNGELLIKVPCNGYDYTGLRYARQVPRSVRDKIIKNEHVSLEKLVTDPLIIAEHLAARKEKQQPQLGKPGYATMNVPKSEEPLPDDIVSKLQVFNRPGKNAWFS